MSRRPHGGYYGHPRGLYNNVFTNNSQQVPPSAEPSRFSPTSGYGRLPPTTGQHRNWASEYPLVAHNSMDYSQYGAGYNYPPGYRDPYAQQAQQQPQQYQPTPPQIRNPFAPPPSTRTQHGTGNAGFDPEYEAQVAQWQAGYAPIDQQERARKDARGKPENANNTALGPRPGTVPTAVEAGDEKDAVKKKTVVRSGGGQTWQDDSLLEWDPTQFRIMVGNLAGEVTDDSLAKAFAQYGVSKARVIRDKRTTKSKGYGFVSFTDGEQGFKAAREMVGKYIGSHPVTIKRSKTDLRPVTQKDNNKHKGKPGRNNDKNKKDNDPLRANTGAHIEKKPVKNVAGMKMLG